MSDAVPGLGALRGRTLGALAVAGTATAALVVIGVVVRPSLGPWAWVAAGAPLVAQVLASVRPGRAPRRPPVPDLSADLRRADLGRAPLPGADLRDRDLTGIRLVEADLVAADLTGATLVDARLDRADLRRATLIDADLTRAGLAGADLRGADLRGARVGSRALARAATDATTILPDGSPASGTGPPEPAGRPVDTTAGRRPSTWDLVRPTIAGLAVTVTVVAVAGSTGSGIGGTGFEIAADLAGHELRGGAAGAGRGAPDAEASVTRRSTPRSTTSGGSDRADDGVVASLDPSDGPEQTGGVDRLRPVGQAGQGAESADDQPLTEVEVPGVGAAARTPPTTVPTPELPADRTGLRTVRIVMAADGGTGTAVIRSALGEGSVEVAGQQQVDLDAAPGGAVEVEVLPGDGTTTASCAILVDGVERSFRRGFPGERVGCQVDLGRGDTGSP